MRLIMGMIVSIVMTGLLGCAQPATDLENGEVEVMTDDLIQEMQAYFGDQEGLIAHTLAVYDYAEQIRMVEGGDVLTVRAAAIYHDIGIPEAKRVHGSAAGKFQEIEGPPIADRIMGKLGMDPQRTDHVNRIIANHHTARDADTVGTIEFGIIWDADALVNLRRKRAKTSDEEFARIIEDTFRTEEGLKIARAVYFDAANEPS